MRQPLVACVGHCAIDHVFHIDRFPDHATKTPALSFNSVGGGMAANAALACARLGARVRFIGATGDDDAGRLVRQQLGAEGIDLTQLQCVPKAHTSASAIIVDGRGERHIFNHLGNALALAAVPGDAVFDGCDAVLVDPRWPAGARAALLWASKNDRLSVLDADVAPPLNLDLLVACAQWVVFSEPGLAAWAPDLAREPALRRALAHGAQHAAVTRGDKGVEYLVDGSLAVLPAPSIQAVDTTGAGDVFHGAFTLALARGDTAHNALVFAAAAAALKCTRGGGARGAPTQQELDVFLQSQIGA